METPPQRDALTEDSLHTKAELRDALDVNLRNSLPPLALILGGLYTLLAVSHVFVLPPDIAPLMVTLAALTALLNFGAYRALQRWVLPLHWAYPVATALVCLVLLNTLLHLYLTADPLQTTNLTILLIGVGFIALSTFWWGLMVGLAVLGWAVVALLIGPHPSWTHFVFAMVSATAVSLLVHIFHRRTYIRLEGLRSQAWQQRAKLEEMLHINASNYRAEQARRQITERLYTVGMALSRSLDLTQILALVLDGLTDIVPFDRGSVMLASGDEMFLVAAKGFPPGTQPLGVRIHIKEDDVFQDLCRTKRPLLIPDVQQRQDWHYVKNLPPARSWLGVPLIDQETVIGMLSLTRERPAPYTADEEALAVAFASQATMAIQNASLFENLATVNRELEKTVQQLSERTRDLQGAYQQLERLDRTKSDFIRVTSHELRTPLTVISGYNQMLLEDAQIKKNTGHYQVVSGIQSGIARLEGIVSSILDMAKIDNRVLHLHPKPLTIATLIQSVQAALAGACAQRQLTLTLEGLEALPVIEADTEAMRKAIYHLLVNALKYTPDGGTITVSGVVLPPDGVELPDGGVEIIVSDTGIGIDPAVQELIFTKFYQTGEVLIHSSGTTTFKGGGPGLGLAITRGIVEAHGGKIWAESPGHNEQTCPGSRFHIVLPRLLRLLQPGAVADVVSPAETH